MSGRITRRQIVHGLIRQVPESGLDEHGKYQLRAIVRVLARHRYSGMEMTH
jgi:hypothetical protein